MVPVLLFDIRQLWGFELQIGDSNSIHHREHERVSERVAVLFAQQFQILTTQKLFYIQFPWDFIKGKGRQATECTVVWVIV